MNAAKGANTVVREASEWLLRLRDERVTADERTAFESWLGADPTHEEAFARMSSAVGGVRQMGVDVRAHLARRAAKSRRTAVAATSMAAVALLAIGLASWTLRTPSYATRVGEQETVDLADGSRIELNTDTRLSVRYGPNERRITLERGEAVFDVAADASRPFIVEANGQQVRAVGTEFVVRVGAERVDVLVMEGVVSVTSEHTADRAPSSAPPRLVAGDTLAVGESQPIVARLTDEEIARNLAWRTGMLQFEGLALEAAVEEVARYTGARFRIDDPLVRETPVWAYFPASDLDGFLSSLEQNSPDLVVQRTNDEVRIARRS